jgi:hypothetical protein
MEYLFIILRTRNGNLIVFDMNLKFPWRFNFVQIKGPWGPKFNMDYNEETLNK